MGRILITGGAGFIGHNTALMALKLGHEVHILDDLSTGSKENVELVKSNGGVFHLVDVRNAEKLDFCIKGMDSIIHLAAQVSVPASFENSESNWDINVNGTANVLKSAEKASVNRVIVASSAAVYGLCEEMPLKESSAGDLRSPYAESKMKNEEQIAEARTNGMEAIAFRFFNVYGPRQDSNGAYAAVISKFISMLENRQAPTIFGDGGQTRDFIHVDDVSKILLKSVEMQWNPKTKIAYNVATQTKTSLLDLLGLMYENLEQFGVEVNQIQPNFSEERKGDIRHSFASIESTVRDFSWEPNVSLETGLKALMKANGE